MLNLRLRLSITLIAYCAIKYPINWQITGQNPDFISTNYVVRAKNGTIKVTGIYLLGDSMIDWHTLRVT